MENRNTNEEQPQDVAESKQECTIEDGESPFGDFVQGSGRSSWSPNVDPNRFVRVYTPNEEVTTVLTSRYSQNASEGLTVRAVDVESHFPIRFSEMNEREQVVLILSNGMRFIGYARTLKNKRLYFPAKYLPKGIPLPSPGLKLPVKISKMIVG